MESRVIANFHSKITNINVVFEIFCHVSVYFELWMGPKQTRIRDETQTFSSRAEEVKLQPSIL